MLNTPLTNRVREMILSGALPPGMRITEEGLAALLGISRTPVRRILPTLAAEGFLKSVGKRGYVVATFSDQESLEALELRGLLEGLAARQLALQGASPELLAQLEECVALGDRLFDGVTEFSREQEQQYGAMNERFHDLIVEGGQSPLLQQFLGRVNLVPFVSPGIIVFDPGGTRRAFELLFRSQGTHHAIVDAIRTRDGARAESLMREHALQQRESMFVRRLTGK